MSKFEDDYWLERLVAEFGPLLVAIFTILMLAGTVCAVCRAFTLNR